MGGRIVDGSPGVSCPGTSVRVAGCKVHQQNLARDVEPLLAKLSEAVPRKAPREIERCPYQN